MENISKQPLIFNIHRFSLDDGPGIRTTVFLKGCPLSCVWCHNPESMYPGVEIAFYDHLCIECGDCSAICPEKAIQPASKGRVDRDRCTLCGWCAEECPTNALKMIGTHYPAQELIEILLNDSVLYETSRGGVTFSGGEPTLHMNYLGEVMRGLKGHNIHIAVQTSGMFDLEEFRKRLLPYIDMIFYDIKLYDSHKHREYTGRGNEMILNNFTALSKDPGIVIVPRVPLIPDVTDVPENLSRITGFLKAAGYDSYVGLPYNSGGISKRAAIGKKSQFTAPLRPLSAMQGQLCR